MPGKNGQGVLEDLHQIKGEAGRTGYHQVKPDSLLNSVKYKIMAEANAQVEELLVKTAELKELANSLERQAVRIKQKIENGNLLINIFRHMALFFINRRIQKNEVKRAGYEEKIKCIGKTIEFTALGLEESLKHESALANAARKYNEKGKVTLEDFDVL